jgi:hypothetical protein
VYLSYETIVLIFLLGLLIGVCLRPAHAGLRSVLRAHRAARRAVRPPTHPPAATGKREGTVSQADQSGTQERAQKVIQRAIELMRLGQAKGWSHALALARAEVGR